MGKFRRSTYLINNQLQLKYVMFISAALFSVSLLYIALLFNLIFFIKQLMTYVDASSIQPVLDMTTDTVVNTITLTILVITIVVIMTIFFSHRIAGPIFRINRDLDRMIESGELQPIRLRDSDELRGLAARINQLIILFQNGGFEKPRQDNDISEAKNDT